MLNKKIVEQTDTHLINALLGVALLRGKLVLQLRVLDDEGTAKHTQCTVYDEGTAKHTQCTVYDEGTAKHTQRTVYDEGTAKYTQCTVYIYT